MFPSEKKKKIRQVSEMFVLLANVLLSYLCSFAFLICSLSKGTEYAMRERVS